MAFGGKATSDGFGCYFITLGKKQDTCLRVFYVSLGNDLPFLRPQVRAIYQYIYTVIDIYTVVDKDAL